MQPGNAPTKLTILVDVLRLYQTSLRHTENLAATVEQTPYSNLGHGVKIVWVPRKLLMNHHPSQPHLRIKAASIYRFTTAAYPLRVSSLDYQMFLCTG